MSGPATLLALVRLLSSGKISTAEIPSGRSLLEGVWGSVFYHPDFTAPALKALGLSGQAAYIIAGCEPIGAINLLVRKRPLLAAATLPLLFQYYGPVLFENPYDAFAGELDEFLSRQLDFAYFSFPPNSHLPEKLSSDWKLIPSTTPIVWRDDLQNWGKGFGDDVKNKLNKARRAKVEIKTADSFPGELWKRTFSRKDMSPPIYPELLTGWCQSLLASGLLRLYTASIESEAVAFRGELIYGGYAYDWLAGSDPAYHSSGANALLMAEIGRELSGLDLEAWDLVGGEIKSIADFKKSFGAKEVGHFQAYRSFGLKGRIFERLRKLRHG